MAGIYTTRFGHPFRIVKNTFYQGLWSLRNDDVSCSQLLFGTNQVLLVNWQTPLQVEWQAELNTNSACLHQTSSLGIFFKLFFINH